MAEEKKDIVMDIVSWKPREEGDDSTHGSHIGPVNTREFTTENVFPSKDMLRDWITSTGKENEFVIIIKSSEIMTKNQRPRMRFACERGEKYRPFINKANDKGGNVK
ncbi:hypothetical protein RHMOL_Rhmol13G0142600 [Rhododendron molle]|uniref:Uncharacterized protein n=1 Tax=Rhododendron molle TaxID=49168 RepID=A0ACC0L6P7_RHOML|nr:hypothetical protein RHMOL_Rhmol13G0142600 [Rhododendron molle]